jgi:tetratricopeptide (TPR) repeat protein
MIPALSAAALLFGATPLPPGHPPIAAGQQAASGSQTAGPLAAPPLTDAQREAGALPAGHPQIGAAAPPQRVPPSSQQLLDQLDHVKGLKDQEKPFDVAAAVGKLYYANGRFSDSLVFFRQALAKEAPLRALYLSQLAKAGGEKALPSADAAGCTLAKDGDAKPLEAKAVALAKAGKAAAAARCAREALKPALDVGSLLGNALFLSGDTDGALAAHAQVLAVSPDDEESLYGHAGAEFDGAGDDLPRLTQARTELTRFLSRYPGQPHAAQAKLLLARTEDALQSGGLSKLPHKRLTGALPVAPRTGGPMAGGPMAGGAGPANAPFAGGGGSPPPLSQDTIDAIQNTERTPEMMKGLAQLLDQGEAALAAGKFQDALDDYKRVVPFMPQSGRAKAGMAWALVGLNKQPMADRVWQVAVGADAAAVDQLGDALKGHGDAAGAQALWSKLAQSAPDYAAKVGLKDKR